MARDIPFAAFYFGTYEGSKYLQSKFEGDQLGSKNYMLAGATAGFVASIFTMPIDAIKTRVQTESLVTEKDKFFNGKKITLRRVLLENNISLVTASIYKSEGIKGFYKGLAPRLIGIIPSASITFTTYEFYKKVLGV